MKGGLDCKYMAWGSGKVARSYMVRALACPSSKGFLFSASEIFDLDSLQRFSIFHVYSRTFQKRCVWAKSAGFDRNASIDLHVRVNIRSEQ